MSTARGSLIFVAVAAIVVGAFASWTNADSDSKAGATGDFETPKATKARDEFRTASARAQQECDERIRAARKKYVEALSIAVKQATKAGDLKEAQRIQSEIDSLANAEPAAPKGEWSLRFSHTGDRAQLVFDGKGNVVTDTLGPASVRPGDDGWVLEFKKGQVMRLSPVGNRFFVEQFKSRQDLLSNSPAPFLAQAVRK